MNVRAARCLVLGFLSGALLAWSGCDSTEEPEVIIVDLEVGTGEEARVGDLLTVHYTGWLERNYPDGDTLDTSLDTNEPYTFRLGMDRVIEGWHQGLVGMRVGGRRRLRIPPALAYGRTGAWCDEQGNCAVPPNTALIFEIDLLAVTRGE